MTTTPGADEVFDPEGAEAEREALDAEMYDDDDGDWEGTVSNCDCDPIRNDLNVIEEWVAEASADQGIDGDEVYADIVHAFLDSEVGDDALRRAEILRRTGVGERGPFTDWDSSILGIDP